jgi:acyl-CoA reductase-like NAD-dependent aldehyde dehydrogenase
MTAITSPIDGSRLADVADTAPAALEQMFDLAMAAWDDWRRITPADRGRFLFETARIIRSRVDEIAALETANCGKLIADTRREVLRAAACFEYYGGYADKVTGTTVPVDIRFHTYTTREPYGVVVGIVPWNAPFIFAAKKIAPAIAFGNSVLLKPALETPLTARLLGEILAEAGTPPGVAQIVCGGADVGAAMVSHAHTALVVFTGSDRGGAAVGAAAAQRFVPTALELGGKSPQIVFADADLDAAVDGIVEGFAGSCGQMCIAGSRLLVDAVIRREVTERLAERVGTLRVGDPRDPATQVGPQATAAQAAKTRDFIAEGTRSGTLVAEAEVPSGPSLVGGNWVAPTVFADLPTDSRVVRDEIFGPVLTVESFDHPDDALRMAHATDFGLAAGVWTSDVGRALGTARELRVGTIWVNTYRILNDAVPFGGIGRSGYGRENGTEAPGLYTWPKSVWISTEPGVPPSYRKVVE